MRTETTGVLYVLDEPSIGLHAANVAGLLEVMHGLVDQGNSLVVVDHNTAIINAADQIIEIGPGAGADGGQILDQGSPAEISHDAKSLIAPFLTGKSTLIFDALVPALSATKDQPAPTFVRDLKTGGIRHVVAIDATPVGKNVRSTVATYTDILDHLRHLFASLPAAKAKHYTSSHFSYNVKAGACPTCGGTGVINLDIQYLPDMQQTCPTCHGRRYNPEVLKIKWHERSIADLLDLDVDTALTVFKDEPTIVHTLQTLHDMGLGYLHLGESTPTLSGGEAQRLKLVAHMGRSQKDTLFVFDEPSVGLHPLDVQTLVAVFQRLLQTGATVIAIEHDLDVIANADYVLDLGPKGGAEGGHVMAAGTPQAIAKQGHGETAKYLAAHLAAFHVD